MANRPAVLEISALAALKLTDALLSPPYYDGKLDFADRSRASGDEGKEKGGRCWETLEEHLSLLFHSLPRACISGRALAGMHTHKHSGPQKDSNWGSKAGPAWRATSRRRSVLCSLSLSQAFTCISLTPFPSPFRFQSSLLF